ncbi:sulfotransferase 1C4-like [Epargyreus clarus]|uniref:sulfotransferase 1C4-like n=1 Tax=Epargyreus clarus TaxID=520877 RepID=UPI003C30DE78
MDTHGQEFPFEILDVEPVLAKELMEHYIGEKTGFVKVGPKGYFFQSMYKQQAASIYSMPIRPDDVFVHSFPRSGTTLTQELVWLIQNNLNYEKARSTKLYARFPMLEFSLSMHPETTKELIEEHKDKVDCLNILNTFATPSAEKIAKLPSPRFIKTHIPLSLLPPSLLDSAKVVHVARDPRDVAVSIYHLCRLLRTIGAAKDFKTHWNYFINDLIYWGPYFEHVKEAWNLRNHPNLLFIFYEDLTNNMPVVLRQIATFLGKSYTDEQINELSNHLRFENFKRNPSVSQEVPNLNFLRNGEQSFLRKGKVGGWREDFDDEMRQQAERWIADNLRDTDLRFPSYYKNNQE